MKKNKIDMNDFYNKLEHLLYVDFYEHNIGKTYAFCIGKNANVMIKFNNSHSGHLWYDNGKVDYSPRNYIKNEFGIPMQEKIYFFARIKDIIYRKGKKTIIVDNPKLWLR